jgi:inorganic triphosphatase YgiF
MTIEKHYIIKDPGVFWSIQTIEQLDKYKFSKSEISEFDDVYLDTKKRRLFAAGYSCRQRSQKKIMLITLTKLSTTKGKSPKPKKWHVQLKGQKNGPVEWPKSEARKRVLKVIADKKLRAIITLHHTRIRRWIRIKDKEVAQVILDAITVIVNGKDQHFKTLKIKFQENGGEDHFNAILTILKTQWALKPDPLTKFEYALSITK